PEEALREVASQLELPLIEVFGVATFFKAFSLQPKGEHILSVCLGTACHVRGSSTVLNELKRQLCVDAGETTADRRFTLETVNCVGACALGPIVTLDNKYHGQMRAGKVKKILQNRKKNP
ncbi:MAG: NAD(P)H-dependent oxidoreductase subunit E, partial [Phycisphaerales bacterium]